jgi:hypothetical protein
VLTGTDRPRKYWNDLKTKLKKEGSELSEKIGQLKMQSSDGKFYNTDVANKELILNMLAEASTKDISQTKNPKNFEESAKVAERGGKIAGDARKALEIQTGKKVVTSLNAKTELKGKDTLKQIGKKKSEDE